MKKIILSFFLFFFSLASFSQSEFDKALSSISSDLAEKLSAKAKKRVAVLYITDINKSTTVAGKYLADVVSNNIVNDSRGFAVFDRDNLNEIVAVKRLIVDGYISIDVDKTKEIGKALSVEAIIIGSYTVLSNSIKLTIKALDSENGFVIASSMNDLPLDSDAATLLGINTTVSGNGNRGFNGQPISSDVIINNPETVTKDCEIKKVGDYCFTNNTSKNLKVEVFIVGGGWGPQITLSPRQTQCFYNLSAGAYTYNITENNGSGGNYSAGSGVYKSTSPPKYHVQGQINVQQCQSQTFVIQ